MKINIAIHTLKGEAVATFTALPFLQAMEVLFKVANKGLDGHLPAELACISVPSNELDMDLRA